MGGYEKLYIVKNDSFQAYNNYKILIFSWKFHDISFLTYSLSQKHVAKINWYIFILISKIFTEMSYRSSLDVLHWVLLLYKMEALFKLKSCSFVLNNQFFINFTFYSFCKISATKACDKRKKLFLMTMTAVFVCDLFLSWWFVKVSEVKCCRHLPKSRVLSCLRFERCFFFQKYLWFLGMEHKQSKCAPEKKKVAVPAPIHKQNPTSNFLEEYFIALTQSQRNFYCHLETTLIL